MATLRKKVSLALLASSLVTPTLLTEAYASDFGCTVLLCLANPRGPMAADGCEKPIKKLFRRLARGKSFPTCSFASAPAPDGNPAAPSWAEPGSNRYDECPAGTADLAVNAIAVESGRELLTPPPFVVGIGTGTQIVRPQISDDQWAKKICVGDRVGEGTTRTAIYRLRNINQGPTVEPNTSLDDERFLVNITTREYGVYNRVEILEANSSPDFIDVFIDGKKFNRVRYNGASELSGIDPAVLADDDLGEEE